MNPPNTYPDNSQIRLGDVQYGFPRIEPLLDEWVKVLTDAQLREDLRQSSHTAGLCLELNAQRERDVAVVEYRAPFNPSQSSVKVFV